MASNSKSKSSSSVSSSFDAFAKVDAIVAKKVIGSDGAASWQSFRDDNPTTKDRHYSSSNAPKAPLKKADKLGTGFSTWDEERDHENKVRKDAGHANTGAGYTNFNKKHNGSSNKDKQAILDRIRPDDIQYFIPSKTFQGWKCDYVFTTRNSVHNTGYFWDGMDSIKKQNGERIIGEENQKLANDDQANNNNDSKRKKLKSSSSSSNKKEKKSKKKRKKNNDNDYNGPVIVHNPNNPMEQMQAILERRNQQLTGMVPTTTTDDDNNSVLPSGWEAAKDPSTGKTYYFHRATGDRSWEKPKSSNENDATGDGTAGENNANESPLPIGWKSVVDKASEKIYYHHTNGEVTWTKPG
jgi:hypothetical protein